MGLASDDRPRQHHYIFAHRELLAIARRFAGDLPRGAASGRMTGAVVNLWNQIGSQLPEGESLPSDGLDVSLHDLDGTAVVLVTLPPAKHGAEAHFVGIVVADERLSAYYVLEYGWTMDNEPRTVLCRWDDQTHVNLGDGPPAQADAFLAAIRTRLGG